MESHQIKNREDLINYLYSQRQNSFSIFYEKTDEALDVYLSHILKSTTSQEHVLQEGFISPNKLKPIDGSQVECITNHNRRVKARYEALIDAYETEQSFVDGEKVIGWKKVE